MPKVLNRKHGDADGIYVGRPTKFGNPFLINVHGTRDEVIELYRKRLMSNPKLIAAAKLELAGRDLVCWCAPQPCHADVLLEIANESPQA
jgi:hypothetical protein